MEIQEILLAGSTLPGSEEMRRTVGGIPPGQHIADREALDRRLEDFGPPCLAWNGLLSGLGDGEQQAVLPRHT